MIAFVPNEQHQKAFFVSPIGGDGTDDRRKADQALKYLVRKALEPLHVEVERADEDTDPGSITPRMLNSIKTADLVVIDLTDHNANVFYEMAIAHGYRRPCVHIISEGQQLPFDVKDMRTLYYTLTDPQKLEDAVTKLRSYAKTAFDDGTTTTPLSDAERFDVVQSSTNPTVVALAEMATRLDRIENATQIDSAIRQTLARLLREQWMLLPQVAVDPNSISTFTTLTASSTPGPWAADLQARRHEVPPAD